MQADDHELKLIYTSENTHKIDYNMNVCFVVFMVDMVDMCGVNRL